MRSIAGDVPAFQVDKLGSIPSARSMRLSDGTWVLPDMTRKQALQIREFRLTGSWRSVATRVYDTLYNGIPRGHQEAGEHLCVQAAGMLGEDPNEDPWN